MATADDIRINGFAHDWGSTKITIDGEQYAQISKISWEHAVEESLVYGQGAKPVGRTRGRYVPGTVSLTMSKASAKQMKSAVAQKAGVPTPSEAIFPIVVQYLAPGDVAMTVELRSCRILKSSTSNEGGSTDAIVEELELSTLEIVEDDEELISNIVL